MGRKRPEAARQFEGKSTTLLERRGGIDVRRLRVFRRRFLERKGA